MKGTAAAFSGLSIHWCQILRFFFLRKGEKTKPNISLGMFPMELHQQGFWSFSSFLTSHRNLGITQDPRVLQAAQPISTRSFWSDALYWTTGVHTNRTSTTGKKREDIVPHQRRRTELRVRLCLESFWTFFFREQHYF